MISTQFRYLCSLRLHFCALCALILDFFQCMLQCIAKTDALMSIYIICLVFFSAVNWITSQLDVLFCQHVPSLMSYPHSLIQSVICPRWLGDRNIPLILTTQPLNISINSLEGKLALMTFIDSFFSCSYQCLCGIGWVLSQLTCHIDALLG